MSATLYTATVQLMEVDATGHPAKCDACVLQLQNAACRDAPCVPELREGREPGHVYYVHALRTLQH